MAHEPKRSIGKVSEVRDAVRGRVQQFSPLRFRDAGRSAVNGTNRFSNSWTNWAGNVTSRPHSVETPSDPMALRRIVDRAVASGQTVRVVGAGHSFTPAAATNGIQVSLDNFTRVEHIAPIEGTRGECLVTVGAGIRLYELNEVLASHGLAMPNLGDIDQQSIAGALSTSTHGTGASLPGLAAQVRGVRLLLASGEVIEATVEKNPEIFHAARVSVGALGILLAVTLRCVPAFLLRARETPMPLDEVLEGIAGADNFPDSNDHFEFYWFPGTQSTLAKFNNRTTDDVRSTVESLKPALALAHNAKFWIDDELLSNGVFQLTNSVSARLPQLTTSINSLASKALSAREYVAPSHEVFVSPRRVRFVEMEYALPREVLIDVLADVRKIANRKDLAVQFPIEVRFAAADDVWLSTGFERDTAYVAVHQYQHSQFKDYFDLVESVFRAAQGRPHWGKMHTQDADSLATLYPKFDRFVELRNELDARGTFSNYYTNQIFGKPSQ